jgi:hypothetical protein
MYKSYLIVVKDEKVVKVEEVKNALSAVEEAKEADPDVIAFSVHTSGHKPKYRVGDHYAFDYDEDNHPEAQR